jgi:hypothetical protein
MELKSITGKTLAFINIKTFKKILNYDYVLMAIFKQYNYILYLLLGVTIFVAYSDVMAQHTISGPLKVNSINPRYFIDSSEKAIYLTGSHVWDNFQDWEGEKADFDYYSYLNFLKVNNHNFIRMWVGGPKITSNGEKYRTNQMPWLRTGPGKSIDGGLKFDLTRFSEEYFVRLRSRVIEAGRRGIYVSVMLFNGLSDYEAHPFYIHNNINGINGAIDENGNGDQIYSSQNGEIFALQKLYIKKVIDAVNDLDNVLYEVGNELKRYSIGWQYQVITLIHNYEKTKLKKHPVGITSSGGETADDIKNSDLFNSPAEWISPRSCEPGQNFSYNPPPSTGRKVIISDTDHLWGVLSDPSSDWVWKSFFRGMNPILMDVLQNVAPGIKEKWNEANRPGLAEARLAMGQTLKYANRVNLLKMVPRLEIASTKYCLANPGVEYLVYLPFSDIGKRERILERIGILDNKIWVDLYGISGTFCIEWFNPGTDEALDGGTIKGGCKKYFRVPFSGDAVLYIYLKENVKEGAHED